MPSRLTRDPAVLGGALVVAGSRIQVSTIKSHRLNGASIDQIIDEYPGITVADVAAALAHRDEGERSTGMIDWVAKAMWEDGEEARWPWDHSEAAGEKAIYRSKARAALKAIREPSEAMQEAANAVLGKWVKQTNRAFREKDVSLLADDNEPARFVWRAMIDAALAEHD